MLYRFYANRAHLIFFFNEECYIDLRQYLCLKLNIIITFPSNVTFSTIIGSESAIKILTQSSFLFFKKKIHFPILYGAGVPILFWCSAAHHSIYANFLTVYSFSILSSIRRDE
jgi:hypothetical protein